MLAGILLFIAAVAANTESVVLQVPYYFDIPLYSNEFISTELTPLNNTHGYFNDFPIYNKLTYPSDPPAQVLDPKLQTVLVPLNNHQNSAFSGGDILYVKLCWPATTPYSFQLSHEFLPSSEISTLKSAELSLLNLFLRIDYFSDFYALTPQPIEPKIQLTVSKLTWTFIPLELHDFIAFLVSLVILLLTLVPHLTEWLTQSMHPCTTSTREHSH